MKPLRPQLSGLIFKLGLFYVLLSLPSLVLVESAILIFEFEHFMHDIDRGALLRASDRGARQLAEIWPSAEEDQPKGVAIWTRAWILRLQRPRRELVGNDSFMLEERALAPIAAAVRSSDGSGLAEFPQRADSQMQLPRPGGAAFHAALHSGSPQAVPGTDPPYRIRRGRARVRAELATPLGLFFD